MTRNGMMLAGIRASEPRLASTYAPAVMITAMSMSPSSVLRRCVTRGAYPGARVTGAAGATVVVVVDVVVVVVVARSICSWRFAT